MKTLKSIARKSAIGFVGVVCCLAFSGFGYVVPVTSGPTRDIDERLLGDWVSQDGENILMVRRFDDSNYVVSYNSDLFRAFHSDVAETSFICAQNLDSDNRTYVYVTCTVSADGDRFVMRSVDIMVISTEVKDSISMRKLLEKNLQNPELFTNEEMFTREKQTTED